MNAQSVRNRCICFLLLPAYDHPKRAAEIEGTRQHLQEIGIDVLSASWRGEGDEDRQIEELAAALQEKRSSALLYLSDAGKICRVLQKKGLPVAGYLHDTNAGEHFSGVPYVLMEPQEVEADSYVKIGQRLAGLAWTIAVTEHLEIREVTPEDLDGLYRLYDEEARRFLEPLSDDREKETAILRAYAENVYAFYGYGMWGIYERSSRELIGRIGFAPPAAGEETAELGYLLRSDYRGRGLTQEAGRAVLDFAREELGMTEVIIRTDPANAASVALAKRLGFCREGIRDGMWEFRVRLHSDCHYRKEGEHD